MLFHDGYVQGVARRHLRASHEDIFRAICRGCVYRQYLIDNSKQGVESRLDRVAAIYRDVAMQDFLKHLGVGNQALAIADEFFD